jgi:hypothetical protein
MGFLKQAKQIKFLGGPLDGATIQAVRPTYTQPEKLYFRKEFRSLGVRAHEILGNAAYEMIFSPDCLSRDRTATCHPTHYALRGWGYVWVPRPE